MVFIIFSLPVSTDTEWTMGSEEVEEKGEKLVDPIEEPLMSRMFFCRPFLSQLLGDFGGCKWFE